MKRLILGKGKVSEIIKRDADTVLSRAECDISEIDHVRQVVSDFNPDVLINCAAKTNLEFCQENKREAFVSNTASIINLLEVCSEKGAKLVHISSGCLFDGNYFISDENTIPNPSVWYTWTKKWADDIIESYGYKNTLILRPRQLISKVPHPTNMITKFLEMESIPAIAESNSITCIEDFKEIIDHLLSIDAVGIYNCNNSGSVSPYEIAMRIKGSLKPGLDVRRISYKALLDILPNRRVNTILSNQKLIDSGHEPRQAIDALDWCLEHYGK